MREREILNDVDNQTRTESKPSFELANSTEISNIVEDVNQLARKIDGNQSIAVDDLLKLNEALEGVKVNFFGEDLTVEEMKEIPDLDRNLRGYKRVLEAVSKHKRFTTWEEELISYLPIEIARMLVEGFKGRELPIPYVIYMSDAAAEVISSFHGSINLYHLPKMSDKQAEFFAHHDGILSLYCLKDISPKGLSFLAQHSKSVYLGGELKKKFKELYNRDY